MAKIGNLSKDIAEALKTYTAEVSEGLEKAKGEVAKDTAKWLRENSPKNKGKYAKGWTSKKDGKRYIVHNKDHYQLTHLLEKGHAKRGGGRVGGQPHISTAEDRAISDYQKRVEEAIKG